MAIFGLALVENLVIRANLQCSVACCVACNVRVPVGLRDSNYQSTFLEFRALSNDAKFMSVGATVVSE